MLKQVMMTVLPNNSFPEYYKLKSVKSAMNDPRTEIYRNGDNLDAHSYLYAIDKNK